MVQVHSHSTVPIEAKQEWKQQQNKNRGVVAEILRAPTRGREASARFGPCAVSNAVIRLVNGKMTTTTHVEYRQDKKVLRQHPRSLPGPSYPKPPTLSYPFSW